MVSSKILSGLYDYLGGQQWKLVLVHFLHSPPSPAPPIILGMGASLKHSYKGNVL